MNLDTISATGKKGTMEVIALKELNVDITVGYSGKTTIAVAKINGTQGIGTAVCMKGDKYSKDIGTNLAASRAIRHIAEQMEKTWYERSTTKAEWKAKHKKG